MFVISTLIYIYSEAIFQEGLEDTKMGTKMNGLLNNRIRYANDTILISNNIRELQQLIFVVGKHSQTMGLDTTCIPK